MVCVSMSRLSRLGWPGLAGFAVRAHGGGPCLQNVSRAMPSPYFTVSLAIKGPFACPGPEARGGGEVGLFAPRPRQSVMQSSDR